MRQGIKKAARICMFGTELLDLLLYNRFQFNLIFKKFIIFVNKI